MTAAQALLDRVADVRKPSKRAVALDVLRGGAALAVVVLHASSGPLTEEAALGRSSWVFLIPNVVARFAVPAFMILSGIGLTLSSHRDDRYPRFLRRRLSSILPEYIVWSLLYTWLVPQHEASASTLLTDLVTGHASRHLYFVPAVVRLYVLYPVLSYCARSRWGVAGCCILSWSMIWMSPVLTSVPLGELLDEVLPLNWIGYFVLGIWLADTRLGNGRAPELGRTRALALVNAIALLCAMLAIVRSAIEQSHDIEVALGAAEPLVFPYSVSIVLWVTAVTFGEGRLERFLTFVSIHSYGVYLSHMLMLQVCALLLQAVAPESTHLMEFSTGVLLGIPLSLGTAVLSERAKRAFKSRRKA